MADRTLTINADTLGGTNGTDTFSGPAGGLDVLRGLGGNDLFKIQYTQTGSIDGGAGFDTLRMTADGGSFLDLNSNLKIKGIEKLVTEMSYLHVHNVGQVDDIAQFQTTQNLSGQFDTFTFQLTGEGGSLDLRQSFTTSVSHVAVEAELLTSALRLIGTATKDEIHGTDFGDKLGGFKGNDTIYGGFGNDKIGGGLGKDTLYGDDGRDTYVFNTKLGSNNVDHLGDFRGQDDSIALEGNIFKWQGSHNGALAASAFKVIGDGQQIDRNDHIIYNQDNGKLYYDVDGRGGQSMKLFAIADNFAGDVPTITHHDFLIV